MEYAFCLCLTMPLYVLYIHVPSIIGIALNVLTFIFVVVAFTLWIHTIFFILCILFFLLCTCHELLWSKEENILGHIKTRRTILYFSPFFPFTVNMRQLEGIMRREGGLRFYGISCESFRLMRSDESLGSLITIMLTLEVVDRRPPPPVHTRSFWIESNSRWNFPPQRQGFSSEQLLHSVNTVSRQFTNYLWSCILLPCSSNSIFYRVFPCELHCSGNADAIHFSLSS